MIGKLLKLYAYSKAPRTTFAVRHPRTSAKLMHARYDMRHSWAPRATAVGAALIALPLGYLAGRLASRGRPERYHPEPESDLGVGL